MIVLKKMNFEEKMKINKVYLGLLISLLSVSLHAQISQSGLSIYGEATNDESGYAVSLSSDGSIIAIGALYNSNNGSSAGSVRVYENKSGLWIQIGTNINGEAAGDYSGTSVALSADGSILAIGAPRNSGNGSKAGHVRVFKNNGGVWTQLGSDIDGETAGDLSGTSVSLSADGSIVAIGAVNNSANGTRSGNVRVFKNNAGVWSKIGNFYGEVSYDAFGQSVSLSSDGSIIAIGADQNDGSGQEAGHVKIFQNLANTWTQIGNNIEGESAFDRSGRSVSLSSDGAILAIGAQANGGNGYQSGHVRIYENIAGIWTQIGTDIDGEAAGDYSGASVSLNSDGSIVAIGAPLNGGNGSFSGHVRIYKNESGIWTQIETDIDGIGQSDRFGTAVDLSSDGSVVGIGALALQGNNGSWAGRVEVYSISSLVTGIKQEKISTPIIYPNPTTDFITIQLDDIQQATVSVTNVEGKEIYRLNNIIENSITFSTSELSKGIYFVKIQSKNEQQIVELIKQ